MIYKSQIFQTLQYNGSERRIVFIINAIQGSGQFNFLMKKRVSVANTTGNTLTNDGASRDDGAATQSILPEMGPNTTRISSTQEEETFPKWPTHCQLFSGSFQTIDRSAGRRPLQHRPISLSS